MNKTQKLIKRTKQSSELSTFPQDDIQSEYFSVHKLLE
jgi:hypothetical protein